MSKSDEQHDQTALGVVLGITGALVVFWLLAAGLGGLLAPWSFPRAPGAAEEARVAALKPGEALDAMKVAQGKAVFTATCAACHGVDGHGMDGKGKNLTTSLFSIRLDDAGMLDFIKKGRPVSDPLNTTKVEMPPKGGNPTLTDEQLGTVVAYVRALQRPERVSSSALAAAEAQLAAAEAQAAAERAAAKAARLAAKAAAPVAPATATATTTATTTTAAATAPAPAPAVAVATADEGDYDAETIEFGKEMFMSSCSTCHGQDAKGVPKNGKDLVHSTFAKGLDDEKLIAFIKRGRDSGDPANTTKIAMPPKGGNPALSDEKIEAIVAYLRSLQKSVKN